MKCPKCDYLGFETGDRCRNCGYDFSLLAAPRAEPELALKPAAQDEAAPVGDLWLDRAAFPLFKSGQDDDTPLVKLPAEPRPPLSVRRTPDLGRSRAAAKPPRKAGNGLTLEFADETADEPAPEPAAGRPGEPVSPRTPARKAETEVAGLGSRALAALIDHAILLGIDAFVIYSTLRMTSLTLDDWRMLPPVPLAGFLIFVKLAYFSAFTAVGGQTIGKMATGIRVVADDHLTLDPARAIGRTITGAVSLLSLGIGLIPAFVGPERRAFHDRVAHTRVVGLPSA